MRISVFTYIVYVGLAPVVVLHLFFCMLCHRLWVKKEVVVSQRKTRKIKTRERKKSFFKVRNYATMRFGTKRPRDFNWVGWNGPKNFGLRSRVGLWLSKFSN